MEHMNFHQTTIWNEEHEKVKLHARDGKDDTFYPPKNRMKLELEFPKEKPVMAVDQWPDLFHFRWYTHVTSQVYKDVINDCVNEIIAGQKAYNEASKFFEIVFGDIEKRKHCTEISNVMCTFRDVQGMAKRALDRAEKNLPSFEEYVKHFIEFRNGPLYDLKVAEDQYYNKLEELAEIPNVGKMMKELLYKEKDDKKIEDRSGFTQRDIGGIIHYLWKNKDIYIPYLQEDTMNEEQDEESEKEDTMNEEQDDDSEMEDWFIQYKDLVKELSSIRHNYEIAKGIVQNHVDTYELKVTNCVWSMDDDLKSVDHRVRIMRRQLELLTQKDVINKGYDEDFDDKWRVVCRGRSN